MSTEIERRVEKLRRQETRRDFVRQKRISAILRDHQGLPVMDEDLPLIPYEVQLDRREAINAEARALFVTDRELLEVDDVRAAAEQAAGLRQKNKNYRRR